MINAQANKVLLFLLVIYVVLFAVSAFNPYDRAIWWAENIPVLMVIGILWMTFNRFRFSNFAYFLVGVFACPTVEICFLAVFALGFWVASYEIIEMVYAVSEDGESGVAFLGSQGDIWDAQKDMFLDICGAIVFAGWVILNHRRTV
jgi:putative membrane protein